VVVARAFHSQWGGTAERWPWKLSFLNRQTGGLIWETALPGMPAWQGLQEVTSFDIADRLVEYCLGLL
jgi:hypothetical protein